MHQKLSLGIIIGISLVVIASWTFLVVPEIKNDPFEFEQSFEFDSRNNLARYVGGELERILTEETFELKVSSVKGNIVDLVGTTRIYDIVEEKFLFYNTIHYSVDKNSKITLGENVLIKFPNNIQKQTYRMFHPLIFQIVDLNFESVENIDGLEIYVYSFDQISTDLTGDLPAFEGYTITELKSGKIWIEPTTGNEVDVEIFFKAYVDDGGESVLIGDGGFRLSEYSKLFNIHNAKDKKNLYNLYDTVIPILLVAISVGSILVVFVNQNLKTRTKELSDTKKKKIADLLYEAVPSPVVTFDQNNKLVNCNQYFLDKMGFSKDELMGMYAPDFLSEKDEKTYRDVILPALKKGKQLMEIDLHIKKKDGSLFHSLWNHIRISGDDNEYMGFTGMGLDLTEIDELRDELVKKEKMVALGNFSSILAHDLRNPLSVIRVSMENLKMLYGTDDTKQSHFDKIERSINRMVHQVDTVLNFVKEQPLTLTKTKTSEIISESLDSLDIPDAIQLILPENDVDITCDKEQLEIALNNLVLNSIQAIVGSGTIEISVEENNDRIVIQVEDSGKGIPKEELDAIFEPLFTTKQQGTGLGLSSVKSIIKAHGGTISVTSPPTIFRIELPKSL